MTGAVPSAAEFIPEKGVLVEDNPDKQTERVNVPSHSWSLSCCDASESSGAGKSYFTGVIAENKAGGQVFRYADVTDMEAHLSKLYGYSSKLQLLADGCGSVSATTNTIIG